MAAATAQAVKDLATELSASGTQLYRCTDVHSLVNLLLTGYRPDVY